VTSVPHFRKSSRVESGLSGIGMANLLRSPALKQIAPAPGNPPESEDAKQVRRLLALAAIYDGASRTQAAEIGGVTLQVVRDWVLRLNTLGPDGLIDRKAPGQRSRLADRHRAALAAIVEDGPIPAVHGVVRRRIIDLCQWVWNEFEISVSKQTLSRELRAMGYRKLSARPRHHAQPEGAIEKPASPGHFSCTRPPPPAGTYKSDELISPTSVQTGIPAAIRSAP
jgi:transposase